MTMGIRSWQCHLALVFVSLINGAWAACQNSEACLYDDLFVDYNRYARPVEDVSKKVKVHLELTVNSLADMDDRGEVMHVVGYISAYWKDEFMTWNTSDYNGTEWLSLPAKEVWLPDLIMENSVSSFYQRTYKEDFLVAIHYSGQVLWEFGGILSTKCEFDIAKYPFDEQTCDIKIGVWTYITSEVDLKVESVDKSSFEQNSLWELEKVATNYKKTRSGFYAQGVFSLTWSRKPQYYLLNFLLPTTFIMVIALGVFWLPPDCGEKVSLGITVLLAFSVLQIIITEATPTNSDVTPLINQMVVAFMAMSAISLLGVMLSLYLNFKDTEQRVPHLIRIIAFKGLARILFLTQDVPSDESQIFPGKDDVTEVDVTSSEPINKRSGDVNDLKNILEELRKIVQKIDDKKKTDFMITEWKLLAKVVDRVLFWLCVLVLGITLLTLYL